MAAVPAGNQLRVCILCDLSTTQKLKELIRRINIDNEASPVGGEPVACEAFRGSRHLRSRRCEPAKYWMTLHNFG